MSDVNRKLRRRNTGQADDQYDAADTDESASTQASEDNDDRVALAGNSAAVPLQNGAADDENDDVDDVVHSAANQNSRAYDEFQSDAVADATASSDSGDEADNATDSYQHQQQLQFCGPDRVFYTPDTTVPYRRLENKDNNDDADDDDEENDEDGDDEDENSDGGFGQFGYAKNPGSAYRPGYGGVTRSNGYSISMRATSAGKNYAQSSAATASAASSEKRRQKSDSPPELAGKGASSATGQSKKQRQQQQQQQRSSYGHASADSDSNEQQQPVHYNTLTGAGQPSDHAAKGKRRKRHEQGVRTTIKAQDVAGNRGQDDIDSLLNFIESNPGARSKKSIVPKPVVPHPLPHPHQQQTLQQPKQKQKQHSKDSSKSASDTQPKSLTSPSAEDLAAVFTETQVQQQQLPPAPEPALETADHSSSHQQKTTKEANSKPAQPIVVGNSLPNGSANSSIDKQRQKQSQLDFTDFDTLEVTEPVQEDAFSVVLSKKERKRLTKRADPLPQTAVHTAPSKQKMLRNAAEPAANHSQQQQKQRHASAAPLSASTRAHNGSVAAASAAVAAAAVVVSPSPPTSGQTPSSTVRTSSSSRSGSPGASEPVAAAAGATSQRRPRQLNPAEYEQLLRQKAQENALLRRDLDSCSPNHSQLVSFLYSLC